MDMLQSKTKNIDGKIALITGATGSLGRTIVKQFSCSGEYKRIYACYRSNSEIAADLDQLPNVESIKINFESGDISSLPDNIDVLVNNVGLAASKSLTEEVIETELNLLMKINLKIPVKLAQKSLPHMVSSLWGRIINIGSIWSLRGSERNAAYTISKHALSGLTKTIAVEYSTYGITCNEVCPGPIDSDMIDRIFHERAKTTGRSAIDLKNEFVNTLRPKRLVLPSEVASAVSFLASQAASGINGVSLPVDLGIIA